MRQPVPYRSLWFSLTLVSSLAWTSTTLAQVIPDSTLGNESSTVRQDTIKDIPSDLIEGGATRGTNLFHSLQQLSIQEGRGAYFANPAIIKNIFSRVTGSNPSKIFGTLGVLGNANLFLINPNGIVFGRNARLDIRGAFVGSTADSMVFENGFEFSTTNPQAPPLLTINIPLGLRFRQQPSDISNEGNLATPGSLTLKAGNLNLTGSLVAGGDLTLEALNTVTVRDTVLSPFIAASGNKLTLQGNQGVDVYALDHPQSGFFSGGDMVLRSANTVGADAHFWSGGSFRIEKLDGSLGGLVSLYDPVIRANGDVSLDSYTGASLHILAGGLVFIPGTIQITDVDISGNSLAETVTLSDGSTINIDRSLEPTVDIRAGTTAVGSPFFNTGTPTSADIFIGNIIFDAIGGTGGKVFLTNQYAPNLVLELLFGGVTVGRITSGDIFGGGSITVDARGGITLNDTVDVSVFDLSKSPDFPPNTFPSNTYLGNGGNVTLLSQGNIISGSSILAKGLLGGNVILTSSGDVVLGNGLEVNVRGGGDGNITINAQNVGLFGASKLITGIASGLGSPDAQAGDIEINATGIVQITDGSLIANAVLTRGTGNTGEIKLNVGSLFLHRNAFINTFVDTQAQGNAGKVKIDASSVSLDQGLIQSVVQSGAIGNAGDIEINTGSISLVNSSILSDGLLGGNITLNSQDTISAFSSLIRSSSSTSVPDLMGGDINLTTRSLSLNNGTIVGTTITGTGRSNAGNIVVNVTDTATLNNFGSLFSGIAPGAVGNTGSIELNAKSFSLTNGGQITTLVNRASQLSDGRIIPAGQGNTGNITVRAKDITIDGFFFDPINPTQSLVQSIIDQGVTGAAGNIDIQATNSFTLSNGAGIVSILNTNAIGRSGDINIKAGSLSISNGSAISNSTFGIGNAGNIKIEVRDAFMADGANGLVTSGIQSNVESGAVGNGGNIDIESGSLSLTNAAQLQTSIREETIILQNNGLPPIIRPPGQGQAGNISLIIRDTLKLDGFKPVTVNGGEQILASSIFSTLGLGAIGRGGDINIKAGSLFLTNNTRIASSTFGTGNAGNIKVEISNAAILDNSGIQSNVEPGGMGDAGEINLSVNSLSLTNAGQIQTLVRRAFSVNGTVSPAGRGNGGNIIINAHKIVFDGFIVNQLGNSLLSGVISQVDTGATGIAGNIDIRAIDSFSIRNSALISSELGFNAIGRGGDINITTGSLSLLGGSNIVAGTQGQGNGGNISVEVRDNLTIDGAIFSPQFLNSKIISSVESGGVGNAGTVELNVGSLSLTNGGQISTFVRRASEIPGGIMASAGRGNGGNITIKANDVVLDGFAVNQFGIPFVSAIGSNLDKGATGDAGNIDIQAANSFSLNNGASIVTALDTNATGRGGDINITAQSLAITNGAQLNAVTLGQGNAGNITLRVSSLNVQTGGGILANTYSNGRGGNLTITASEEIAVAGSLPTDSTIRSNLITGTNSSGDAGDMILNTTHLNIGDGGFVSAGTTAGSSGRGGDIIVTASDLNLQTGGQITTGTLGKGRGGDLNVNTLERIEVIGSLPTDSTIRSALNTGTNGSGDAGNLTLVTQQLNIKDSGIVSAGTENKDSTGQGGILTVTATESVTVEGITADGNRSTLATQTQGKGNAGDLILNTRRLFVSEGASVSTATLDAGMGGTLNINASESIIVSGGLQNNRSALTTETSGTGNAGNMNLVTGNFSILDGAIVSARTFEKGGDGGDIVINTSNSVELSNRSTDGLYGSGLVTLTTGAGKAGNIQINTGQMIVRDGAQVVTGTESSGSAGNLTVNASNFIKLEGRLPNSRIASGLLASTGSSGDAKDITLNTPRLILADGAIVSAQTTGMGNSGNITVNTPISVILGENSQLNVETSGAGKAGNIDITSDTVTIGTDAQISATAAETATNTEGGGSITINASNLNIAGQLGIFAETQGQAPAGTLTLNPDNLKPNLNIHFIDQGKISASTSASGRGGNINISAPDTIDIRGNGAIATTTSGSGNAGTINLNTNQLNIVEGVEVTASTTGTGDAGQISITANTLTSNNGGNIQTNTSSSGNAGDITLNIKDNLNLTNSTIEASTDPNSTGDGGNITIAPTNVTLTDNARISVNSQGQGDGGNISLTTQNLTLDNRSEISATTASGEGGNLTLRVADTMRQRNNSSVSTTAGGTGNGGNITLNTKFLINTDNSNITANAFQGTGGNVNITTTGIFLDTNSLITASSQFGVDGVVETNTLVNDPSQGLVTFPVQIIDPNALIAQNACRKSGQSEFIISGRGGLPSSPEQVQSSDEVAVGLVRMAEGSANRVNTSSNPNNHQEIVPAQGWISNGKGQVVLVAENPNNTQNQRQINSKETCSAP